MASIITQLEKKLDTGQSDPYYIGTSPKYVKSTSSNVNNLEEEMIIGVNKSTLEQTDVDEKQRPCYRKTIKYCAEGTTFNYYILEVYQYGSNDTDDITLDYLENSETMEFVVPDKASTVNADIQVQEQNRALIIGNNNLFFYDDTDKSLRQKIVTTEIGGYQSIDKSFTFYPRYIIEKDFLYYQTASQKELVSTKTINRYSDSSGTLYTSESILTEQN